MASHSTSEMASTVALEMDETDSDSKKGDGPEVSRGFHDDLAHTGDDDYDDEPSFYKTNKAKINLGLKLTLLACFCAYFIAAMALDFQRAIPLVGITAFVAFCVMWAFVSDHYGDQITRNVFRPLANFCSARWGLLRWVCLAVLLTLIGLFIGMDVAGDWHRLISLCGMATMLGLCWLGSWRRNRIRWRPVFWGLGIEIAFGFLVLKWPPGYTALEWLSGHVSRFLLYSDEGAIFVFGDAYMDHFFAFKVLPVVIFFAAFMGICYYFGLMQMIISKISWVMQVTLGTSAAESLNAAGNIFLGQTEAPLLIKPFLPEMTMSELHAVMTGGFGTIAGSVMAAFIGFGISPSSLMAASVMAAPTALALTKVVYPETEISVTAAGSDFVMPKSEAGNVIEAAAKGASDAVPLVANIAAAMIAFVSLLGFINNVFQFVGWMVGIEGFTFEFVCSYVLRPLAFLMGAPWDEAGLVGSLLGLKTFVNEFVAYTRLSEMVAAGQLCKRSETIATFALCGFANFGSIAIQIGGLGAMAPGRYKDLARIAFSAMLTGTMVTWMNASVAGLLTPYDSLLIKMPATPPA